MTLDGYNYIVIGMTASQVNVTTKTVKVRVVQWHGLPGNPNDWECDSYVEDKDLPDAMIMCPLGMSIDSVATILSEIGTLVYVQFSEGEMCYPIVVGWVGSHVGERAAGSFGNTRYIPPANTSYYNVSPTTVTNTYAGNVYNKLEGNPGSTAPNDWFILPFSNPSVNWKFIPYNPFNDGYLRKHSGIDLGGVPGGYPVYAICDCIITHLYVNHSSMGNAVECNSTDKDPSNPTANAIIIRYMHLNGFAEGIAEGQSISQGTLIGYVGSSGSVTGVHLHLDICYPNGIDGQHIGDYRDPARVLGITDQSWISPYEWESEQVLTEQPTEAVYSSLASKYIPMYGNHSTTRSGGIDAVVIHYTGCVISSAEAVVAAWQNIDYTSSNYIIESDGTIAAVIPENLRAYTSSSWDGMKSYGDIDNRAITIEVACEYKPGLVNPNPNDPNAYYQTDTAINACIALLADIGTRYGITWNFIGDEDHKIGTIQCHKWYDKGKANTPCPGPYLESKLSYIADQANALMH